MQKMKESKYLTVTTTQHSTQPPSGSFFFCLCVCVCVAFTHRKLNNQQQNFNTMKNQHIQHRSDGQGRGCVVPIAKNSQNLQTCFRIIEVKKGPSEMSNIKKTI